MTRDDSPSALPTDGYLLAELEGDDKRLWDVLSARLLDAINSLLDVRLEPMQGGTLREEALEIGNSIVQHAKARLERAGLENEQIAAEIATKLARRDRILAEADLTRARAATAWTDADRERFELAKDRVVIVLRICSAMPANDRDGSTLLVTRQAEAMLRALESGSS